VGSVGFSFPRQIEVRWRDIRGIRSLQELLRPVLCEKVLPHPWIVDRPAVNVRHPAAKNLPSKGTKFSSIHHDALNEVLRGSVVITWKPSGSHKTVNILL
jgi:hypothetical protein